ncbi:tat pathway signal sequence [Stagonosporopsis vannaccii]|nr:tat pathway signal sequence [Stagonosporopsis vannaccii]
MLAIFTRLFRRMPKHTHLPQSDTEDSDNETLLPASSSVSHASKPCPQAIFEYQVALKTLIVCSVVYLSVGFWIAYGVRKAEFVTDADDFCINHVSQYSPVVREVRPGWHTKQFNGSFLHQSVYRQSAGPEVDAAWEALGVGFRSVVVSETEAEQSGIGRNHVKLSQDYGGGYPANVEGLHHLHCLDLLRKTLYWNYDYYLAKGEGPFINSEYIVRIHTTHCLDMLRQVLMCNPDVGVLGQIWWQPTGDSQPMAFVDFSTKHRCRDYDSIRRWAEAHQMPSEGDVDMGRFYEPPKPEDVFPSIP